MNFNDYQKQAMGFRLRSADSTYALLNLAGEVGELASLEAKARRDGVKDFAAFKINVKKELGDILWCVAAVAADYNLSLDDVAQGNIAKLTGRKAAGTIQGSGDER